MTIHHTPYIHHPASLSGGRSLAELVNICVKFQYVLLILLSFFGGIFIL